MEFKKCARCGCFFTSNDSICFNCLTKEKAEMSKFKTFIDENKITDNISINTISSETGLSNKTINRFLDNNEFSNISINLK